MPPISIMIKPASSTCNMRCKYCFYNDVAKNRETPSHGAMSLQTAETVVKKAFAYADGNPVWFNFQGGEPDGISVGIGKRKSCLPGKRFSRRRLISSPAQISKTRPCFWESRQTAHSSTTNGARFSKQATSLSDFPLTATKPQT